MTLGKRQGTRWTNLQLTAGHNSAMPAPLMNMLNICLRTFGLCRVLTLKRTNTTRRAPNNKKTGYCVRQNWKDFCSSWQVSLSLVINVPFHELFHLMPIIWKCRDFGWSHFQLLLKVEKCWVPTELKMKQFTTLDLFLFFCFFWGLISFN